MMSPPHPLILFTLLVVSYSQLQDIVPSLNIFFSLPWLQCYLAATTACKLYQ